MQFTTKTTLPIGELEISHTSGIILLGSCFANNIGNRLQERKFDIESNPFGVLYNPMSIASALRRRVLGEPFDTNSQELFEHNSKWHSIMHHSDFSGNSMEEVIENINASLVRAHTMIKRCRYIVITFGTAYAYIRKADNTIVGNCHKLPACEFERRLLDVDKIAEEFDSIINTLKEVNSDIRFIFTVSPIRHLRDGAHDNQKSKSTLLLAVDRILEKHGNCHYFPAYEIMLDELRDYRFYADDMVHPSSMAIEYIWECFGNCYFSDTTQSLNNSIEEITKGMAHRPFDISSPGYRSFITNLIQKIDKLTSAHHYLDFEKETIQCNTILDR